MRAAMLVCLIGCGGGGNASIDAAVDDIDAAPDIDAAIDAARPPATHLLFLSFEGEVLTKGTDDAVTNRFSQIPDANPRTLVLWAQGAADRATRIQTVTTEVRAALAPFDVDVVTTRPATGPYHMVVFTHSQSQDLGIAANLLFTAQTGCGANMSELAVVFQPSETSNFPHAAANPVVLVLGLFFGIENSAVPSDCMCANDTGVVCTFTQACTIGGANTARAANSTCGTSGGAFDVAGQFLAKIGAHP